MRRARLLTILLLSACGDSGDGHADGNAGAPANMFPDCTPNGDGTTFTEVFETIIDREDCNQAFCHGAGQGDRRRPHPPSPPPSKAGL